MAITFPLALPAAFKAAEIRFISQNQVAGTRSRFSGKQQIQAHQGQWLEAEIALPVMVRADADAVVSWGLKLNGRRGTALIGDLANPTPRGSAGGTPLVAGAGQTGQDLATDGWPVSTNGVLLAGDWIQIGTGVTQRLYKVLDDADSDGAGAVTLTIFPPLRESPADNAAITVSNAQGVFRLASNELAWDIELAVLYGMRITLVEAI